ncbi:MAG: hypothetical protein QOI54_1521 [Actinomycetota bacterium]|nr:hypothetical protein [Actinomycetota bacterium]
MTVAKQSGRPGSRRSLGDRIYNTLFRFLGPAQLGPYDEPAKPVATPDLPCPRCGAPMSEHTYVETRERKRLRCPAPGSAQTPS